MGNFIFFFFSSRRRHTRFSRDWSSDVCSSDLRGIAMGWWNGAMAGNADAGKEAMRREMRARRAAVGVPERLAAAAAIEEAVLALPAVREAGTVLVFYSFGSEVPTSGLVERLLAGGHRVLLPFLDAGNMEAAEVLPG